MPPSEPVTFQVRVAAATLAAALWASFSAAAALLWNHGAAHAIGGQHVTVWQSLASLAVLYILGVFARGPRASA